MKFGGTISIDQPYEKVAALFADSNNLKEWQEGRTMELEETIINNQLPHSFEAVYHHIHMDNTLKTSFIPINDTQTEYKTEGEYTRVSWVMPKLMMILFPSMFKKQAFTWMENFKRFAESQE